MRSEVRGQIAEVKTLGVAFHLCNLTSDLCNVPGFHLCNLTSDLCNVYNGLVPDVKPFRLTESVKAAG